MQKESEEEAQRLFELLNEAMLEYLDDRVAPMAENYVEVFEAKLNQFNWGDNEDRLENIGTEFVKEYKKLELKLFDEFDTTVFEKTFHQPSDASLEYRNWLKTRINNCLNNIAAEPLERIMEYVKKRG